MPSSTLILSIILGNSVTQAEQRLKWNNFQQDEFPLGNTGWNSPGYIFWEVKLGDYFWFHVPADLKNKKQFHLFELEVKIIAETVLTIYLCVWLRVKTQKCTLDLLFYFNCSQTILKSRAGIHLWLKSWTGAGTFLVIFHIQLVQVQRLHAQWK